MTTKHRLSRLLTLLLALTLALTTASTALALGAPGGPAGPAGLAGLAGPAGPAGPQGKKGQDIFKHLSPEKQQAVRDIFEKHRDKMSSLRITMWGKKLELDTLIKAKLATKSDVKSLVKDMVSLHEKIQKEQAIIHEELEAATGLMLPPMPAGPGEAAMEGPRKDKPVRLGNAPGKIGDAAHSVL